MINNPRKIAINKARERAGYKQPMDPTMSKDYDNSGDKNKAEPDLSFSNPLTLLNKRSNIVKDYKQKDKLAQALLKAKNSYVYSSGNLRKIVEGPKRPHNNLEET